MSGLRECRLRVRPRTVRFRVLTRCLTASAWLRGRPAMLDVSSAVVNSRPYVKKNVFIMGSIKWLHPHYYYLQNYMQYHKIIRIEVKVYIINDPQIKE